MHSIHKKTKPARTVQGKLEAGLFDPIMKNIQVFAVEGRGTDCYLYILADIHAG